MNMNIGIVTVWTDTGAGYVSRAYEEALSQRHKVYIYAHGSCVSSKGDPFWDRPNVTWDPGAYSETGVHWRTYKGWIKKNSLDVIIFNEQRDWDVVLRTRQLGLIIGAYVDYYTSQTVPLFELYDFLICHTRRHLSVFQWHPRAHYVRWGTDCDVFSPRGRILSDDGAVVFFHSAGMGGANYRKGTMEVIDAFLRLSGNVRLVIHSQVPLSQFPRSWQEVVNKDARIEFIQGTVKPPGLYHLGDVYVYPSKLEGLGLTIPEALASGLPVITIDNPPMNEFVVHGRTGWLVPVQHYLGRFDGYYWPEALCNLNALARAMQVYVDNPDILLDHKTNARLYAEQHLSWERNQAILISVVEQSKKNNLPVQQLNRLKREARRYDWQHNPTPSILLLRAVRMLGKHLYKKITRSVNRFNTVRTV